jgi:hypothetical protein
LHQARQADAVALEALVHGLDHRISVGDGVPGVKNQALGVRRELLGDELRHVAFAGLEAPRRRQHGVRSRLERGGHFIVALEDSHIGARLADLA